MNNALKMYRPLRTGDILSNTSPGKFFNPPPRSPQYKRPISSMKKVKSNTTEQFFPKSTFHTDLNATTTLSIDKSSFTKEDSSPTSETQKPFGNSIAASFDTKARSADGFYKPKEENSISAKPSRGRLAINKQIQLKKSPDATKDKNAISRPQTSYKKIEIPKATSNNVLIAGPKRPKGNYQGGFFSKNSNGSPANFKKSMTGLFEGKKTEPKPVLSPHLANIIDTFHGIVRFFKDQSMKATQFKDLADLLLVTQNTATLMTVIVDIHKYILMVLEHVPKIYEHTQKKHHGSRAHDNVFWFNKELEAMHEQFLEKFLEVFEIENIDSQSELGSQNIDVLSIFAYPLGYLEDFAQIFKSSHKELMRQAQQTFGDDLVARLKWTVSNLTSSVLEKLDSCFTSQHVSIISATLSVIEYLKDSTGIVLRNYRRIREIIKGSHQTKINIAKLKSVYRTSFLQHSYNQVMIYDDEIVQLIKKIKLQQKEVDSLVDGIKSVIVQPQHLSPNKKLFSALNYFGMEIITLFFSFGSAFKNLAKIQRIPEILDLLEGTESSSKDDNDQDLLEQKKLELGNLAILLEDLKRLHECLRLLLHSDLFEEIFKWFFLRTEEILEELQQQYNEFRGKLLQSDYEGLGVLIRAMDKMKLKVKADFLKLLEFDDLAANRELVMESLETAVLSVNQISELLKTMLSLAPKDENEDSIQLLKDLLEESEKWQPEQQFYHLLHSHLTFLMDMLANSQVSTYDDLQAFCQGFLQKIKAPEYTTVIKLKYGWYLPLDENDSVDLLSKFEKSLVKMVIIPFINNVINDAIAKINSYLKYPLFICENEELEDMRKLARLIEDEIDALIDFENFELSKDLLDAKINEIQAIIASIQRIIDTNNGLPFPADSTDDPLNRVAEVNPRFKELKNLIGIYATIHSKGEIRKRITVLMQILSIYEQRGSTDAIEGNVDWLRGLKVLRLKLDEVSLDLFRGCKLSSRESLEDLSLQLQELAKRLNNLERLKTLPELRAETLNIIVKAMKTNDRNCLELEIDNQAYNSLTAKINEFLEESQSIPEYIDHLKNYLANLRLLRLLSSTKEALKANLSNPISSGDELKTTEKLLQSQLETFEEVSPASCLDLRLEILARKQKSLIQALLNHFQQLSDILLSLSTKENSLEESLVGLSNLRDTSGTEIKETGSSNLRAYQSLNETGSLIESFIQWYRRLIERFQARKQGLDRNLTEFFNISSQMHVWIPKQRFSEFNSKINNYLRLAIQITLVKISNMVDGQDHKALNGYIIELCSLENVLENFVQSHPDITLHNIQSVQRIVPVLKKYTELLQIEASIDDPKAISALAQNSNSIAEYLNEKKSSLDRLQSSLSPDFSELREEYNTRMFVELLTNLELSFELSLNNAKILCQNKLSKMIGKVKEQFYRLMGRMTQTGKALEPTIAQKIIRLAEMAVIPNSPSGSLAHVQKVSIIAFYKTNTGSFLLGIKVGFYDNVPFKKILLRFDALTQSK